MRASSFTDTGMSVSIEEGWTCKDALHIMLDHYYIYS